MRYPQPDMTQSAVRLHRWDEIALEKVTEMLSRKIVSGDREMLVQSYVKRGCLVPMHAHDSEQMTYVLQGALKFLVGGEEITVREGEVLHIPPASSIRPKRSRTPSSSTCSVPLRPGWLTSVRRAKMRASGCRSPHDGRELVNAPVPVVRPAA